MPLSCSEAAHLLGNGAAEFKAPTTAWSQRRNRWEFVRYNPETGRHHGAFSHFDQTSATDEEGRTSGAWHPVFETIETRPFDGGLPFAMGFRARSGSQQHYDPRADFRDYALQLLNDERGSDCLDLALLIYKAGQVWSGNGGADAIVSGLLSQLTEYSATSIPRPASDANFRVGIQPPSQGGFGDTGFNGSYGGVGFDDGSNQVRHFTAFFATGYSRQLAAVSDILAYV